MTCQAYGCSTRPSNGKSLHSFPDPVKKKELFQTWIYNLNLQEASFTSTKNKVVCKDHFETSCFEGNMMGRLLGFTTKLRRLKSDAVPTVFAFDQNCRVYSNQQTRKRVLNEIHVPNNNGIIDNKENSVLIESKEDNIPLKKKKQILKAEEGNVKGLVSILY